MSLRKAALIVGIDDYSISPLSGCVNDALAIAALLTSNHDGSPGFACDMLLAPRGGPPNTPPVVTRSILRSKLKELLAKQVDMFVFYFSGHGTVTDRGGLLVTQDCEKHDEGIMMAEVVSAANASDIPQITIIVDACYSGKLGDVPGINDGHALLNAGVSILAASSPAEAAIERGGRGVFTSLVCGALEGGAADVMGEVTAASIYAYCEQALGPLDQRPMFKANVSRLSPLRTAAPGVPAEKLRKLKDYFATADGEHQLDPAYEPDPTHHPENTVPDLQKQAIFKDLQRFNRARLLLPVGHDDMFWAAIGSMSCKLTPLGKFYWKLSKDGRI